MPPRYSEAEARAAVAASMSYAETLRRLGMCSTGNGWKILKKYAGLWGIPTDHFRPNGRPPVRRPLEELLVEGSTVKSAALKERLYESGLKQRQCELCGQGEEWFARRMSLVLDHINGTHTDNRLGNLRIVCPNCNATLDTHCGRNVRVDHDPRECARCGEDFVPKYSKQRYCSQACGSRWDRRGKPLLNARRAERPPAEELLDQVARLGYEAVGRTNGVSGVAIRKWLVDYGIDPPRRRGDRMSDEQAKLALELLAQGATRRAVAARVGITVSAVGDLKSGRTYRHLPRPPGLPGGRAQLRLVA